MRNRFAVHIGLLCTWVLAGLAHAQTTNEQDLKSVTLALPQITDVILRAPVIVQFNQDASNQLEARGEQLSLENLIFRQSGSTLAIDWPESLEFPDQFIRVKITIENLISLKSLAPGEIYLSDFNLHQFHYAVSGGADLYAQALKVDSFHSDISGSADVNILSLSAKKVTLQTSGSGDYSVGQIDAETFSFVSSGAGDLHILDYVNADTVKLAQSGSGDSRLNRIEVGEVEMNVSGSGDVEVAGSGFAERLSVNVAGSGNVNTLVMIVQHAELSCIGSGDIQVHAKKTLRASAVGSGSIQYQGNPDVLSKNQIGSGSVSQIH